MEPVFSRFERIVAELDNFPGIGITPHIDALCFGDTICSLSFGADIIMTLSKDIAIDVLLKRRSLLVLSGQAGFEWQHGIAPRKTDECFGEIVPRRRRVSITFRNLKANL